MSDHLDVVAEMLYLAPTTQQAYRRWIHRFSNHYDQHPDLTQLNTEHAARILTAENLRNWLVHLKQEGLAKQSILQARGAVNWLAQALAEQKIIPYDVPAAMRVVRTPRITKEKRRGIWLSTEQSKELVKVLKEASTPKEIRDRAIIILMLTCGLRAAEVQAARWSDLRYSTGAHILAVHGKASRIRMVQLPTLTIEAIERWRVHHPDPTGDQPMFIELADENTPLRYGTLNSVVRAAGRAIGVEHLSPHDLRRTFARGAYYAGANLNEIQSSLGHTKLETTQGYINAILAVETDPSNWTSQLSTPD